MNRHRQSLSTFTFANAFSAKNQACGPEARAVRTKSIGGNRIQYRDPSVIAESATGPSGARPGAPTSDSPFSWEKKSLPARADKWGAPQGFCAHRPCFRAWHQPKLNKTYNHLLKRKKDEQDRQGPCIFMNSRYNEVVNGGVGLSLIFICPCAIL